MPNFSARLHKVAARAIHTVKVSIASSRQGIFSAGCFLLIEQSLSELRPKIDFCIQISIDLKIKITKCVVN
jgi:hypothetical protein